MQGTMTNMETASIIPGFPVVVGMIMIVVIVMIMAMIGVCGTDSEVVAADQR